MKTINPYAELFKFTQNVESTITQAESSSEKPEYPIAPAHRSRLRDLMKGYVGYYNAIYPERAAISEQGIPKAVSAVLSREPRKGGKQMSYSAIILGETDKPKASFTTTVVLGGEAIVGVGLGFGYSDGIAEITIANGRYPERSIGPNTDAKVNESELAEQARYYGCLAHGVGFAAVWNQLFDFPYAPFVEPE